MRKKIILSKMYNLPFSQNRKICKIVVKILEKNNQLELLKILFDSLNFSLFNKICLSRIVMFARLSITF